jgi:hypothetical protein
MQWDTWGGEAANSAAIAGIAEIARHRRDRGTWDDLGTSMPKSFGS